MSPVAARRTPSPLPGLPRRRGAAIHAARNGAHIACLLLLGTLLVLPAQAQWKWRDAEGRIQYSDRPPPGSVPDKDVLQRPGGLAPGLILSPVGAAASGPQAARPAASAAARPGTAASAAADAEQAARRKADEARQAEERQRVRAENCRSARDQIRLVNDGVRLARVNAQGEREFLDDAARSRELERARAIEARDCN